MLCLGDDALSTGSLRSLGGEPALSLPTEVSSDSYFIPKIIGIPALTCL